MNLIEFFEGLSDRSPKKEFIDKLTKTCRVKKITVYRWLKGISVPDKLKQEKLSEITGIPENELFSKKK